MSKIVGWKIKTYCRMRTYWDPNARVLDRIVEFGNSPIRDRKSRKEFINDLIDRDIDFEVISIIRR